MFLKPRKESTDPRLRSLLQKAVRRGNQSVVESTARRLNAVGDKTWLRSRAVVITFEECWPLAAQLEITTDFGSRLAAFLRASFAVKQKDAAGLGAMAYALGEGDESTIQYAPDHWAMRVVAEGLARPASFFEWAKAQCSTEESTQVVEVARKYLAAATWGWDKTCILAGAFLAAKGERLRHSSASGDDGDFPYWVALDKHTPEGKDVLREIARENGVSYRHLIWCSFYFESAAVNASTSSPWWDAERRWRLSQAGLTVELAEDLWSQLRMAVAARLESEADALRKTVHTDCVIQKPLF